MFKFIEKILLQNILKQFISNAPKAKEVWLMHKDEIIEKAIKAIKKAVTDYVKNKINTYTESDN